MQGRRGVQVTCPRIDRTRLPRDIVAVSGAWAGISDHFGPGLVRDVVRALRELPPTVDATQCAASAELFLGHLQSVGCDLRALVAQSYAGRRKDDDGSDLESLFESLSVVFQEWSKRPTGDRGGSVVSAYAHSRAAGRVLMGLGGLEGRSYLPFKRPASAAPRPEGETPTIGGLAWPELEGLDSLSRERAGLSLVIRAMSAAFDDLYRTFEFGAAVLASEAPPSGVDDVAWRAVRECLQGAKEAVAEYAARKRASAVLLVGHAGISVRDPITWVRAGLPHICVVRAFRREPVADEACLARLALKCLGSSRESAVAAGGIFSAETGWNKQSTFDLPRRFVAFKTEDGTAAVGDAAFVASFKRRAGHHVLATINRTPARGLVLENALAHWNEASADGHGSGEVLDGRRSGRALEVLERYARLAEASRLLDPKCAASDLLFVFPCTRADYADDFIDRRSHRIALLGGAILTRGGVGFKVLRASRVNVDHGELGCAQAVAERAGQRRASTAMRHYLRTAVSRDVWDAHIRFFHDACQAVLLDGRPQAVAIVGLEPKAVAWCRHLASASGIALAGEVFAPPEDGGSAVETFGFRPTDGNLRDLYIARRALRRAVLNMPPRAWAVRCMPLLALLGAVRKALCDKGLLPPYLAAARAANRDLAVGLVALPPVWGA